MVATLAWKYLINRRRDSGVLRIMCGMDLTRTPSMAPLLYCGRCGWPDIIVSKRETHKYDGLLIRAIVHGPAVPALLAGRGPVGPMRGRQARRP